jgi:hypothetical protein
VVVVVRVAAVVETIVELDATVDALVDVTVATAPGCELLLHADANTATTPTSPIMLRCRITGSMTPRQAKTLHRQTKFGMTCLPMRSMVCMTVSWSILYGFTRQSSRSTPAAS